MVFNAFVVPALSKVCYHTKPCKSKTNINNTQQVTNGKYWFCMVILRVKQIH